MSETESPQPHLNESPDEDIVEYRAVSTLAVTGLIFALLSVIALVDPMGWIFPPVGLVLCGLALRSIASNAPALVGRKAALLGLMLSVALGTAAVTEWFGYRWMVRRQAREFAMDWFDLLATGQPHKAHQLTRPGVSRQPLDGTLWESYGRVPEQRMALEEYVEDPLVRALLALGETARVRFRRTVDYSGVPGRETVIGRFAVTFEQAGRKKTFLVDLWLRRSPAQPTDCVNWHVYRAGAGAPPPPSATMAEDSRNL